MAAKKPAKQKQAKDLDVGKAKGGAAVKGGARISKTELLKLQATNLKFR